MAQEKRDAPRELEQHYDLSGFTLPANVRLQMGESGLMVGAHYSNGMGVSGIVEKLTYIGSGVVRVAIGDRVLLVFATGMVAEVAL